MIRVALDDSHVPNAAPHDADAAELIALDDALTELEQLSVRSRGSSSCVSLLVSLLFCFGLLLVLTIVMIWVGAVRFARWLGEARTLQMMSVCGSKMETSFSSAGTVSP